MFVSNVSLTPLAEFDIIIENAEMINNDLWVKNEQLENKKDYSDYPMDENDRPIFFTPGTVYTPISFFYKGEAKLEMGNVAGPQGPMQQLRYVENSMLMVPDNCGRARFVSMGYAIIVPKKQVPFDMETFVEAFLNAKLPQFQQPHKQSGIKIPAEGVSPVDSEEGSK